MLAVTSSDTPALLEKVVTIDLNRNDDPALLVLGSRYGATGAFGYQIDDSSRIEGTVRSDGIYNAGFRGSSANLFASWETYAEWAKEPAGSRKAFGRAMRARGFAPCRIGNDGAKGFKALQLRRHSEASVMLAALSGRKLPVEGL